MRTWCWKRPADALASFDAALANMPHGVALYDSEQRVLLANRRYAEMYGLQPGDIKPGMTMKEILELRAARGVYLGDDATRYVDGRVSAMATPRSEHDIERYANGRIIEKSRKPIPGGGWVSVHEDVTDRQKAVAQIAHMAHHDGLTNLPNRALYQQRLGVGTPASASMNWGTNVPGPADAAAACSPHT